MKKNIFFLPFLGFLLLWACNGNDDSVPMLDSKGIPEVNNLFKEIAKSPDDPALFMQLGKVYYDNEGFDEAIQCFQKAIQLDSSQTNYYHRLADVYWDYNKSYEALTTMQRASGRFPDSTNTLLMLSEMQMKLKTYKPSMETAKRVLNLQPMNDEAFYMIGMNLKYLGDTLGALKSFQTVVDRNEDHLPAYQELAILCDNSRKDELALQYFDNALRIDSLDQFTAFNLANFYQRRKQDNAAIYWYQRAVKANKNFPEPYYNIGIIYLEYDSFQVAYNHFNIAANLAPDFDRAFFYRGLAAEKMGKKQMAMEDYNQAYQINPDNKRAKRALGK